MSDAVLETTTDVTFLGAVANACDPSTLGAQVRRVPKLEASLEYRMKPNSKAIQQTH